MKQIRSLLLALLTAVLALLSVPLTAPSSVAQQQAPTSIASFALNLHDVEDLESSGLRDAREDPHRFDLEGGLVPADEPALLYAGGEADALIHEFALLTRGTGRVLRVHSTRELRRKNVRPDPIVSEWLQMLAPELSVPLAGMRVQDHIRAHASYIYHDASPIGHALVPLIFRGRQVRSGVHTHSVSGVDVAPALAASTGAAQAEPLDGRVMHGVLRSSGNVSARGSPAARR